MLNSLNKAAIVVVLALAIVAVLAFVSPDVQNAVGLLVGSGIQKAKPICVPGCIETDGGSYDRENAGTVTLLTGEYVYDKYGNAVGCKIYSYSDRCEVDPVQSPTEPKKVSLREYGCLSTNDGGYTLNQTTIPCNAPEFACSNGACKKASAASASGTPVK